jgi:hypothetical protein
MRYIQELRTDAFGVAQKIKDRENTVGAQDSNHARLGVYLPLKRSKKWRKNN